METEDNPTTVSNDSQWTSIREGKAEIMFPGSKSVFYNPVQEFNRDLSSAVIRTISENLNHWTKKRSAESLENVKESNNVEKNGAKREERDDGMTAKSDGKIQDTTTAREHVDPKKTEITILEGLSASGLRSVRYALEVPRVDHIVANDISADAFTLIQKNIQYNKVDNIVTPSKEDVSLLMYKHRFPSSRRFTFIDLDPYGTAAPFLDGAVQAVADGGLLLVTCTDMGVLCGNHSDACYGKYGSMSLKAKFCHEMALRLLLSSMESHANRYKRHIRPLLSISVDFYIRVFVQVFTSAAEVKRAASKQSLVYHCTGCGSFHFQQVGRRIEEGPSKKYPPGIGPPVGRTCDQCGGKFHLGGPIWTEPIHDAEFIKALVTMVKATPKMYNTSERIIGLLSMVMEEVANSPLYYTIDHLSNVLHCNTPSIVQFRSAVLRLGYKVSGSHACRTAIKTNAPNTVIWDIMKCWVKLYPVKRKKEGSPGTVILSKEPQIQASFEYYQGANPPSRQRKLLRFQENPEANWGPKARAKKKTDTDETMVEKRERLQGKRLHDEDNTLKKYPCKRFKSGKCEYGDNCKYSHITEPDADRSSSQKDQGATEEQDKDSEAHSEIQRRDSEQSLLF